jgi:hypothetical protein
MARLYYHDPDENPTDWEIIIVFGIIVILWWGLIHFLDWLTFDFVPWWIEPFTIMFTVPIIILCGEFGTNPLTWWPLVWGTKVAVEGNDFMAVWNKEEALKRYGGPLNVYYNVDYIKFRRRQDAVTFCLFQKTY